MAQVFDIVTKGVDYMTAERDPISVRNESDGLERGAISVQSPFPGDWSVMLTREQIAEGRHLYGRACNDETFDTSEWVQWLDLHVETLFAMAAACLPKRVLVVETQ